MAPIPSPRTRGELLSVFAPSGSDVWAVGFTGSQTQQQTNVLHWDGSAWSRVPAPSPGRGGVLRDIHGLASNDLWAVGVAGPGTLTLRWDGSVWTSVPVPNPGYYIDGLHAVAEISAGDAWAGGMNEGNNKGLEWTRWHWNGVQWSTSLSPSSSNDPADIAADASNDVFVAGTGGASLNSAEVDHFDGSTWTQEFPVTDASGDARGIMLMGQDVWIAGDYRLQDGRFQTMVAVRCQGS